MRVALKHKGILPNPNEVRDLLSRTRGFFENVLKLYCDTSYAEVSLIDLVPNEEVRTIMTTARLKFVGGSKENAMIDLQLAFHKLQRPEGQQLPGLQAPKAPTLPSELQRAGWESYLKQLHAFLEQSANATNALILGVDPVRYSEFLQTGPTLQWR